MTNIPRRLDPDIFAAARKALDDDPRVPATGRQQHHCGECRESGRPRSTGIQLVRWVARAADGRCVKPEVAGSRSHLVDAYTAVDAGVLGNLTRNDALGARLKRGEIQGRAVITPGA